ncbi:hypothetical protein QL285_088351 [Trifolium repens]|nr:hypothetical protein QL285_088351 [Trifolium repens]
MLHLTFNLLSLFKGRTLSCRYLTSTGLYVGTSSIIQTKKALSKSVDYIIVSKVCASRTKDLCYKLEGAAGSMDEVVRTEGCEDIH